MGMGFAPTWLRQVSPLLHKTTLTTVFDSVRRNQGETFSGGAKFTGLDNLGFSCIYTYILKRKTTTFSIVTPNKSCLFTFGKDYKEQMANIHFGAGDITWVDK